MVFYSTDSHWSISFKVHEASNIKNVKIPSYPSIYENVYKLQKIFLVRVFWLKYIFRIKFKIPQKTVFHLKGYTPVVKILITLESYEIFGSKSFVHLGAILHPLWG